MRFLAAWLGLSLLVAPLGRGLPTPWDVAAPIAGAGALIALVVLGERLRRRR